MFEDRADAGRQLADKLRESGEAADWVLAVPRGGLPVGRAVADALGAPLDVVVARKIGAPGNPELALGAVSSDGSAWLNQRVIDQLQVGADYVEQARAHEAENAARKREMYQSGGEPHLTDRAVVIVDDGIATGATTIACVRHAYSRGAARVVLAVPVAPPDTVRRLEHEADAVVAVETPADFMAVGQFYRHFQQVSDDEARAYLEASPEGGEG